jgi:outer membrane protein OmpA-like peptidoglycan-associated protein
LFGIQLELGFVALGGSRKAPPEGLAELGGAAGGQLLAGLRVRPFKTSSLKTSLGGLWLGAGLGGALTGGAVAPALDGFLGYDFAVTQRLAMGPALGYLLVIQADKDVPRPANAHIGMLGINVSFDVGVHRSGPADRDHDGILDARDGCPDQPEDTDGFQDQDGCPDRDNDQDGILDPADRCPNDPEDKDNFEDEDGCSDPDNDRDEILDAADECPMAREDADGFEDADGCPELDNDADKIPDSKDLCPNEPEILNGIADNDGCPDSESVRVVGDKIELDQKIHFWTNSHVIRAMSYPVLDKLARFLLEHPEYVHVDIEGHADQRGDEEFNLDLSRRRAHSILEFLVKRGLEEARLSSQGFGSSRPLVDAQNEGAWFMNRRVEFVVTRNREVKVVTGVPAGDTPAFGRDKPAPATPSEEIHEEAAPPSEGEGSDAL